jgi:bifunctional oligoribonuclease and PAP phosphatase NrnA
MKSIQEIWSTLKAPSKIVVTMHQKPDGDAMGSALGLAHFLQQLQFEVQVIAPTNWAHFLDWMPGVDTVIDYEAKTTEAQEILAAANYIFCLDFNHASRVKFMEASLRNSQAIKVLIDHHEQPDTEFFTYGISIPQKSSTCQMVYDFIVASEHSNLLNSNIAACLFTGLITDTGSFRFAAADEAVHKMAAHLKSLGINHTQIYSQVYDNFKENRLRFLGHVLLNRMEVLYEYNTVLIAINKHDIAKYDIKTGDTEGLVNYGLSIEGIEMATIIIDRIEEIKCSFRSKRKFDVNSFARKYFNGGGHYNAAGGGSKESLEKVIEKFKLAIHEEKQHLQ